MSRRTVKLNLRECLLGSASTLGLTRQRAGLFSIVLGAAMAYGIGFGADPAMAAAVSCSPDASGSAIASSAESCSGPGDGVDYSTAATTPSTVTLNSVTISGAAATGVSINNGGFDVSLVDSGTNTIDTTANSVAHDGVFMTGAGGNVTVNLQHTTIAASGDGIHTSATTGITNVVTNLSTLGSGSGIYSTSTSGDISIVVSNDVVGGVATGSAGTGSNGIVAISTDGSFGIDATGAHTISAGADGIFAQSSTGTIGIGNLNFLAATFTGAANAGIETINASGGTQIRLLGSDMSGLGAALYGIKSSATTGRILIRNYSTQIGSSGDGVNQAGIDAIANTSDGISIDNQNSDIFVDDLAGTQYGIHAVNSGSGFVSINSEYSGIKGGEYAIFAQSAGNVYVDAYAASHVMTGSIDGIFAQSTGGGSIAVGYNVFVTGSISGAANAGIEVVNTTGSILVQNAATISGSPLYGIRATTTTGAISINNVGEIGPASTAGIWAESTGANVIYINVANSASIHLGNATGTYGIYAVNAGNGTVNVQNHGNIDPPDYGIFAKSAGDVNVDSGNATIAANIDAIYAESTGTGNVTVGFGGPITGVLTGATNAGIETVALGGSTLIQNQADLSGLSGALYGIKASSVTGAITIHNIGGQIGAPGLGNGVNQAGIDAASSDANTGGILVDNHNANIYVDAGNATSGIHAVNAGAGTVQLANFASNITGGAYGIYGQSVGSAIIDTEGASTISGTTDALFAKSTGGGTVIIGNLSGNLVLPISGTILGATNAGIETSNTAGQTLINNSADMSGLSSAAVGIGALSTTGSIYVRNSAQIGNVGAGNGVNVGGITAVSSGANAAGVQVDNFGNIFVDTGNGTYGINAGNPNGTGAVTVNNFGTIDPPAIGINAVGGGPVFVTNAGLVGATNTGIRALGASVQVLENLSTGNATTLFNPAVVSLGGPGIVAESTGGNVFVTGYGNDGLPNTADDGLAGPIISTGGDGIHSQIFGNASAGNIVVTLAGSVGYSVVGNVTTLASAAGTVTVNSANGVVGIGAATLGSGNVTITALDSLVAGNNSVTMNATASGANNVGILGSAGSGSTTIATHLNDAVSVTGDNSIGIDGQSVTGNVNTTIASAVTVAPNSTSGTNEGPTTRGSVGIEAQVGGATGNVTVTGNSTIDVTNNAAGPAYGVYATNAGNGTLAVTVNANITANNGVGAGVLAFGGTGAVTITNNAFIRSTGTVTSPSVVMGSTGGAITLNNSGVIQSTAAGLKVDDLVIGVFSGSGPITINNAGRIGGRIDVSGASASTFNNTSALSWHTAGLSLFSGGNDLINNSHTGLIATSVATTFAFSNGIDSINNGGTFIAGELGGPSSLTITKGTGTVTLNNSGTIILGSVNGTTTDGETNDQILAQGAGLHFVSSGTSRLLIDAKLGPGAEAQNACGSTPATYAAVADCMTIGASSGTGTRVTIHDTTIVGNVTGLGAINLQGTVIIDATAGSANDFALSTLDANVVNTPQGPAIVKGFVQYELLFDPTNFNWDLVGLPTVEVFELSKVTAGLQTLWYETAGSWNERTWLVRSQLAGNATRSGWSLWSKAYGGWINRDSTNTLNVVGTTVSYDTTYWQSYYGIQFGGDYLVRNGNNGAWMIGLLGGYNRSDVDFDGSVDGLHYTVYNAGGYVSYMNGPVFADLLVKDDFARVNLDLPSFAGITHPNANSLGGEFTVGARFGGGASGAIVIEPMGTVSYVNTTVDAVDWPGMSFNWQNGTSFRGTLGVKLSADFGQGQNAVQPFIMGGFGDEFKGDNQLSVTSGGNASMINDKPIQTFATASFGLNFSDAAGWSGFIRGDGLFASNYTSGAIRVGVRDQF